MIYKNFYIKYKMSHEINSKEAEKEVDNIRLNISEDDEPNVVLEKESENLESEENLESGEVIEEVVVAETVPG